MKPIRLAFSGSGFKTPAHVGALLAVLDAGYTPIEYAGTSGGSIVAALAASGHTAAWMQDQSLYQDWSNLLTFSPWSLLTQMGYCSGSVLLEWLHEATAGATFDAMPAALTVMASDIATGRAYEFSREKTPGAPVALAVRASAAIPLAYAPVQFEGAYLMDGGLVNNIPADRLTVDSIPRLGIQLVSQGAPMRAGLQTIFSILPRVVDLMLSSNESTHVRLSEQLGACICFVETGYASGLDRNMPRDVRERLLDDGYAAARLALSQLGGVVVQASEQRP